MTDLARRRRRCVRFMPALLLLSGLLAGPGAAQGTTASAAPTVSWATVTYLSGTTVYLEVGTRQGVREGTAFEVVRAGVVVGHLAAKYVSSTRTAGTIADSGRPPLVGDSVRFHPVRIAAAAEATGPAAPPSAHARISPPPVRGRVGLRYLVITTADGTTMTQPEVDLRLDGAHLAGTGVGLAVDVRASQTSVSGGGVTGIAPANLTRVYQAALFMQPGSSRVRWTLGRQFATALSPIGIFDGGALDLNVDRWSAGVLAGTQPDAVTFSPSGEITEYGIWVQRHNGPGSHAPWSATFGAIGSYDAGQINREYMYLRGTYNSRRFSLYAAEEVDANRGWRLAVEGAPLTPTSTFATAQFNATDALSLSAGVDSRRSVRLYRDFINPETVFDDAFRQGNWGEIALRVSSHLRLSTDVRNSDDGSGGAARAYTGSLSANRITPFNLGLRIRSTQYTGPLSEGNLTSVALDASPSRAIRLSLNAGQRTSATPGTGIAATRLTWTGADVDVAIGRSLYLMLSTYRETGTPTASTQSYGALSWRF